MTDKEIIKALGCCKMPVGSGSCNDCPFDYQRKKRLTSTDKSCTTLMFDYALDLINRQQAEIERLNNNISAMARTLSNSAKETRAEAIKEFTRECRQIAFDRLYIRIDEINNLEKEFAKGK